jgi:hypothetical protein
MTEKVPILVVLGVDIDGKPHASRFPESDALIVTRAAQMMGFHVVRVAADNAELRAIAKSLPLGKVFRTGRAFVPFVARAAFDKLATLVEGGIGKRSGRTQGARQPPSAYPVAAMFDADAAKTADTLWSKIEIGAVVLASQPHIYGEGWWESIVVAVNGDRLTLRWTDTPAEKPFYAARRDVALRHPSSE